MTDLYSLTTQFKKKLGCYYIVVTKIILFFKPTNISEHTVYKNLKI